MPFLDGTFDDVALECDAEAMLAPDIDLIEPLGADTLVYGRLDGHGTRLAARLHATVPARTGRLPLRYRPADAHYFDATTGTRID